MGSGSSHMLAELLWLSLTLCGPVDCVAHQAPLSVGFSRQEYWSGLSCPHCVKRCVYFHFTGLVRENSIYDYGILS